MTSPESFPVGWDIGDAIDAGWDEQKLLAFMREHSFVIDDAWLKNYRQECERTQKNGAGRETKPAPGLREEKSYVDPPSLPPKSSVVQLITTAPPSPATDPADESGFSDDRLALEFSSRHQAELRYVPAWNKWYRWSGSVWQDEQTLLAFEFARKITREAAKAASITAPQSVKAIRSAKTVAAIVNLARSDRRHAVTPDIWDVDTWLLNTPAGTVNLRNGELQPHNQADHITKTTAIAPDWNCATPVWNKFLSWATCGDASLRSFLQRICGYSATGDTREHALFFLYGEGGNGKGTFINTIMGCLKDYGSTSSMDTFIETGSDRHPTELAKLRGARLVTSQETEKGRKWAQARIQMLTGGDPVDARFMRQDFFTYVPQFKLMIAGNHKPSLSAVNEAIRRRFNLIPFVASLSETEKDIDLPAKLKAEWPGILAWIIDGCIEWQETGLSPPPIVTEATEEYLASEDTLTNWIEEKCECSSDLTEFVSGLYSSWKAWAEKSGERAGSKKSFTQNMESHGFKRRKGSGGSRMMDGICLMRNSSDDD